MVNKQKYVIIVAGGSGKRMGMDLPKQFIEVAGKPILMHTLEQFHCYDHSLQLILVLPKDQHSYWKELSERYNFSIKHIIATGGKERFHSVKNGLSHCAANGLIAVHDGVRPLVSKKTIADCFNMAEKNLAAVPVIPANESIRQVINEENRAVNRKEFYMVQTPQVFDSKILHKAYEQKFSTHFTDDASVVEALGNKVHLVDGNVENIKITRPMDIRIAELLLQEY